MRYIEKYAEMIYGKQYFIFILKYLDRLSKLVWQLIQYQNNSMEEHIYDYGKYETKSNKFNY